MHTDSTLQATTDRQGTNDFPQADAVEQERLDENLHFGRAWHRYQYCYRRPEASSLRILDAACGTGRATVEAAQLNPWAGVLGIDSNPAALPFARERAEKAGLLENVSFLEQDPALPLPESLGAFDFIICRGGLADVVDPVVMLKSLAAALAPDGLVYLTVPSRAGRVTSRCLRQAVDAILPEGSGGSNEERLRLGVELVVSLHHDHPIRVRMAEAGLDGNPIRFVADALGDAREWSFDDVRALLVDAGLRLLYLATPWRWRPDRVFAADSLSDSVRSKIQRLDPEANGKLIDALDASLLGDEYRVYACHASFEPIIPTWFTNRMDAPDPNTFERLVPHLSGLMTPLMGGQAQAGGRLLYRTVSGALGELDRWSSLMLEAVDGVKSCAAIEKSLSHRTRASDDPTTRHQRWTDLADGGLVFLEDPEAR